MNDIEIIPIKKIFSIINSCVNEKQLDTCEKLAELYTQMSIKKGIINPGLIKHSLLIKINEKREELNLSNKFNGKIRRKKIKIEEVEKELIENFM